MELNNQYQGDVLYEGYLNACEKGSVSPVDKVEFLNAIINVLIIRLSSHSIPTFGFEYKGITVISKIHSDGATETTFHTKTIGELLDAMNNEEIIDLASDYQ